MLDQLNEPRSQGRPDVEDRALERKDPHSNFAVMLRIMSVPSMAFFTKTRAGRGTSSNDSCKRAHGTEARRAMNHALCGRLLAMRRSRKTRSMSGILNGAPREGRKAEV